MRGPDEDLIGVSCLRAGKGHRLTAQMACHLVARQLVQIGRVNRGAHGQAQGAAHPAAGFVKDQGHTQRIGQVTGNLEQA